ncbi:hypothetical protein Tco_0662796, partial [Tanacetum coccineum]
KKKKRAQRATGGDKGGRGLCQFSMKGDTAMWEYSFAVAGVKVASTKKPAVATAKIKKAESSSDESSEKDSSSMKKSLRRKRLRFFNDTKKNGGATGLYGVIDFPVKEPCLKAHDDNSTWTDDAGLGGRGLRVFLLELIFTFPRELRTSLGVPSNLH